MSLVINNEKNKSSSFTLWVHLCHDLFSQDKRTSDKAHQLTSIFMHQQQESSLSSEKAKQKQNTKIKQRRKGLTEVENDGQVDDDGQKVVEEEVGMKPKLRIRTSRFRDLELETTTTESELISVVIFLRAQKNAVKRDPSQTTFFKIQKNHKN